MKVMVYNGVKDISVEEVESLPMDSKSVRIRTLYTGISHGTEMTVYRGTTPQYTKIKDEAGIFVDAPQQGWKFPVRSCDPGVWYMGYALVGEIIEVGSDVTNVKVGDVVCTGGPHISEYVTSANNVDKLPEGVKPENGVLFKNLITVFNGVLDSHIKLGDVVAVSGLGVLGQLIVQLLKLSGATVIGVDMIEKRLETAKANGADYVFSAKDDAPHKVKAITNNKGADLVIEVSGNQMALQDAMKMAHYDGVVTCLGFYQGACANLNLAEEFHNNRVTLRSSQANHVGHTIANMWDDNRRKSTIFSLLPKLKLDNLITQTIPFDNVSEAFKLIDENPADVIQVVLKY